MGQLALFLLFLGWGKFHSIYAISTCELSFAYRQLCPNPMFVSGGGGVVGSNPTHSDSSVSLGNNEGSGTRFESSSSCSFFKDMNDASVISGIHVSDQQWRFNGANKCNHVVKFVVDPDRNGATGSPICKREIGIRLANLNDDDRWNVYLWHNFTFGAYQAKFLDSITNHGYSKWDVACTSKPQFVQIIILTSKNSKCSLLVQQYRMDSSGHGCDWVGNNDPDSSFQFCGAYDCSESNNLVQKMKLRGREHPLEPHLDLDQPVVSDKVPADHVKEAEVTKVTTKIKDMDFDDGQLKKEPKEADLGEWAVKLFFPAFGILFIAFLLSILRGSYAKQICRRGEFGSQYHGSSTISVDKEGLQL